VTDSRHLIGLLLGTENDWPSVFEHLVRRAGRGRGRAGNGHTFDVERITVEPFDLRYATVVRPGDRPASRTGTTTRVSG
jgi:hypothetical protein